MVWSNAVYYLAQFAWLWGYVTCLVTWGAAVETAVGGYLLAFFLIFNAALLTLLEVYMPLHEYMKAMTSESYCWFRWWDVLQSVVNDVVKALIYTVIAVLSCIQPQMWLAVVSGIFTLVLGLLSVFRYMNSKVQEKSTTGSTASHGTPYRRFDGTDDAVVPPTRIELNGEGETGET